MIVNIKIYIFFNTSYETTFRHSSLDNFLVQILHTHACFEKRGEYVVLSASSKNGGSSTAGPMGMVTQVPTKTYAGLYTFKCVYKHYIPTYVLQLSNSNLVEIQLSNAIFFFVSKGQLISD